MFKHEVLTQLAAISAKLDVIEKALADVSQITAAVAKLTSDDAALKKAVDANQPPKTST